MIFAYIILGMLAADLFCIAGNALYHWWSGRVDWRRWWIQNAIAYDQRWNTRLGGMADETLSSRSYRMWRDGRKAGWMMKAIDLLFFWQKLRPDAIGHCHQAYLHELERLGLPESMRASRD